MTDDQSEETPRKGHSRMREAHEVLVPLLAERGFIESAPSRGGKKRELSGIFVEAANDDGGCERGVIVEFSPGGLSPYGHISADIRMPSITMTYRPEARLRAGIRRNRNLSDGEYVTVIGLLEDITPADVHLTRISILRPADIRPVLMTLMAVIDEQGRDWWAQRDDPELLLVEKLELPSMNQMKLETAIALAYTLDNLSLASRLLREHATTAARLKDPTNANDPSANFVAGMSGLLAR